ncbi:caspase family protein [Streptomyces sp. NTK 937]|uniref:caspase family protein n=1 Tax=Streptomyces sp. NTK 937 TaxID=1487711 RepID=UPI0004A92203|nr:caspase family protein [Streptomyces sp. NTK 937]KDQ67492.1 von Willebrand factor A [Streptomyces sp. NTK 937]
MPPYDARGEENQGKRHRAVLIGVESYTGSRNDLPAVAANLRLMTEALTAEGTGVLDPDDLVVVPRAGGPAAVDPLVAHAALRAARDEATGLLIVYFAGHAIVRPDGGDLNLMFTASRVTRDRRHPFVDTLSWSDSVMPVLRKARADWVVVILDCCFAGNALASFSPAVDQNFALLTAAEPGVEIPPGDPVAGTEFTSALHRLLTRRAEGAGPATFTRLVTGVREAMEHLKAVDGHPWIPDELRHGDDVVLARAKGPAPLPPEPVPPPPPPVPHPPEAPWWRPVADRLRSRLPVLSRRVSRTTVLVVAGAVLLAGAGAWILTGGPSGAAGPCAPPLELRVLTDPDLLPTVQKAADVYMARGQRHCRDVNLTVYAAQATDAVAAFRSSSLWQRPPAECPASGDCPRPQRDVGAQPDIWIPAALSTWRRALDDGPGGGTAPASVSAPTSGGASGTAPGATKTPGPVGESAVRLEPLGAVAYTPMVLAVPESMPVAPAVQTGHPLGAIVSALKAAREEPVAILRPDPEGTDGALLATEALYATDPAAMAGLEQTMAQALRPMPSTASELMCALADGSRNGLEDRAAVLVPEQTMARFNLPAGDPGRPSCATVTLERRVAQYPSDVPVLDLPFVQVTWRGAERDADERAAAVRDFHRWLSEDPGAQRQFTDDGFRGAGRDERPAPPRKDSPLRAGANERAVREQIPPRSGETVTAASLTDTLRRYREALGPGRVLYLLDNSTSMTDSQVWEGQGRAKDVVARSMSSLGPKDTYGVRLLAVEKGEKATDAVPFGAYATPDGARRTVAGAPVADLDARVADGIRAGLVTLRDGPSDDRPRLLVLVTDDEDSAGIGKRERDTLVADAAAAPLVRIVTVSLRNGGCAPGGLDDRLGEATGGRCLDLSDDITTELAAEVAKTGTGDAQ